MTIRPFQRMVRNAILGGGPLTSVLLAWLGGGSASAQAPTGPTIINQQPAVPQTASVPRNYLNLHTVKLPIQIDEASRQRIQEIHLYVKDRPGAAWTMRDKVGPAHQEFIVQLPREGEYWFAMVTIDRQGRSFPADLRNLSPGLCVVIDTQAPRIDLTNLGASRDGQLIQCDFSDRHLDIGKSRLFFQGGDRVFREMQAVPGQGNVFCIPAQAVFTGVIRAWAEDLAGNRALAEGHVSRLKTPVTLQVGTPQQASPEIKVAPESFPKPLPKQPNKGPEIVSAQPRPEHQTMTFPAARPTKSPIQNAIHRPDGSDGPHWAVKPANEPDAIATPRHQVARPAIVTETPGRKLVNGPKVFLDYQIENAGLSGVGKVEAWITRDKGQSWHKIAEDTQRKSPIEIHLPGEGLFGVTLVASNGRGVMGTPPATGDAPNGWIEVDTTKPVAQITEVRSATADGKAVVNIHWSAHDQNLGNGPVELLYAATPQGPWLSIAKGLNAEGQYRWAPPIQIGPQAHLRLIATDAAGNKGIASTLEPVLFDDPARPRAIIRSIRTSETGTTQEPPPNVAPTPAQSPPPQIVQPSPRIR